MLRILLNASGDPACRPSPDIDEMLAILAERNAIMKKKDMEATQAKWNQIIAEGFGAGESED